MVFFKKIKIKNQDTDQLIYLQINRIRDLIKSCIPRYYISILDFRLINHKKISYLFHIIDVIHCIIIAIKKHIY
jgi:hypothetical protein